MVETIAEQTPNTPKDKKEKKGYIVKRFFLILLSIIFVVVIILSGILIWHNMYYQTFFVNGQSMCPTLNMDATDSKGVPVGYTGGSSQIGYRVEFGILDSHKDTLSNLKRGNVVITYYSTDYTSDGSLIAGAATKIKRIAALPGDKFYINSQGVLFVNDVETNISDNVTYYKTTDAKEYSKYKDTPLGTDEYFVMGDNRSYSHDSRFESVGPVKLSYIIGKAVATEGTCTIASTSSGKLECNSKSYHYPMLL